MPSRNCGAKLFPSVGDVYASNLVVDCAFRRHPAVNSRCVSGVPGEVNRWTPCAVFFRVGFRVVNIGLGDSEQHSKFFGSGRRKSLNVGLVLAYSCSVLVRYLLSPTRARKASWHPYTPYSKSFKQ